MTAATKRLWILFAICAGCTLASCLLVIFPLAGFQDMEVYSEDFRLRSGRKAAPDSRLAFVAIDQPSYTHMYPDPASRKDRIIEMITTPYPWSREVWAAAIERLLQAGARVVALDIVFNGERAGDEVLKAVLEKHKHQVVIGANYVSTESEEAKYGNLQIPPLTVLDPGDKHPMEDPRIGVVNPHRDPDDIVRSVQFREQGGLTSVVPPEIVMESFGARILRQAGYPEAIPDTTEPVRFRYAAEPGEGFPTVPLIDILDAEIFQSKYSKNHFFKDRIVLVGPSADIFHDMHRTPFRRNMLGPEIHLNALTAALHNEFLHEASLRTNLLLTGWAGMVAWLLTWRFSRLFQRFSAAVLCVVLYLLTAQMLYDYADLFISIVSPVLALSSGSLIGLVYDFAQARREKAQLRRTLERYVAKDVVRELIDNPQTYLNSLTGIRKPVTVFFSDVRGFTTLTEATNAALLVRQLNEYFQEMVSIVVNHRGRLDKFIGDAVMADWGSFVSGGVQLDAERAVTVALEMREALKKLNLQWKAQGMQELAFGIGINHGEVVGGNQGSEEKMEVAVIGDAVNLASRLESLTKQYNIDLLLGETVATLVRSRFVLQPVDLVIVKGKTQPVQVFTIPEDAATPGAIRPNWMDPYEQGIQLYRTAQFQAASQRFQQAATLSPSNPVIPIYLERCRELLQDPPPPQWNGVFEMTKK